MKIALTVSLLILFLAACSFLPTPQQSSIEPQANYWQQVGEVLNTEESHLVVDNSGNPVVTVSEVKFDGIRNVLQIYVKRWNGSTWLQLGGSVNFTSHRSAEAPRLATDVSGSLVISFEQRSSGQSGSQTDIYVKRWTGSKWVSLGSSLDINITERAEQPDIVLDNSGNPMVSWLEGETYRERLYVKYWNGSNWVQLGNTFLNTTPEVGAIWHSLAIDGLGNPVVVWSDWNRNIYVKRWTGSSWIQMGNPVNASTGGPATAPSIAIDNADSPIVSWLGTDGTNTFTYVSRWNGSGWEIMGDALDIRPDKSNGFNRISIDNVGNPVVSWEEGYHTYVKRWNGSSWVQLGTYVESDSRRDFGHWLALDSSGNLFISLTGFTDSGGSVIRVMRFFYNSWQDLGGILDVSESQSAVNSVLTTTSDDKPIVAWVELDSSNNRNIYVRQWTGTSWIQRGAALDNVVTNEVRGPSLALSSGNRPVVAWEENKDIYVKSWSASGWSNIGPAVDRVISSDAITPSLALDSSNGRPVVAYVENKSIYVRKASASSTWLSPYGNLPLDITASNTAYLPSLGLTSDNRPIVAWHEDDGTSTNIYVKEWNGTAWIALGGALDTTLSNNAKDVVLAVRSDNRPVIAWEENGNIYVKRWNGSAWVAVGGVLDKTASNIALRPSLDLKSGTTPVVAWQEQNGSSSDIYAKAWNGSSWVQISTTAADKVPSNNAQRPSLVLKSDNTPIISWDEHDGRSENIYVRQY